jgi:hypothetical protein
VVTKIMEWACITALLMVVSWRPFAGYQLPLNFVVCVGSVLVVLALFLTKQGIETHYDVDNKFNPARRVTVKVRA